MNDELALLDATGQAELVRTGEVTPVELTDAAIERVEALNPTLNAVVTPMFERALDRRGHRRRTLPGRAVPPQGPRLRDGGRPVHRGLAVPRR